MEVVDVAVLNIHHLGGRVPDGAVSVMRGTPFGNPYRMGAHGDRAAVVRQYRALLWRRLRAEPDFAAQVRALHGRDLVCCCAPLACHADVLQAAAAWLAAGGLESVPGGSPVISS